MKKTAPIFVLFALLAAGVGIAYLTLGRHRELPEPLPLGSAWQMQDVARVPQTGGEISQPLFTGQGWYPATVPGTVLTTLVNNGVYPEPLYGQNNRPDRIPESLCRTSYWYRTSLQVPPQYRGRKVWLNFAGINYAAEVWINGRDIGTIKGAFARGTFEVTSLVSPGHAAAVAVLVSPPPHPGTPVEHTVANGMGRNGGDSARDGPTFLSTIGWDWLPGVRDRDTGIWQKVFLSAAGPVALRDPLVTSDLPLPGLDSADLTVQVTVQNTSGEEQKGVLKGRIGDTVFEVPATLSIGGSHTISLDPHNTPSLHIDHPRLWWPNGYGPQNLYTLQLSFEVDGQVSDRTQVSFGIRKVAYSVPGSKNLTLSVNGVPVYCRGGDWGLDEGLKRIPRERLEAQIRMHQLANLNMIRNWVGQSTGEDFYELCDKYGIMLWDDFFQPNPGDGPDPSDVPTYLANVREKILRFRNHPSVVVWCGRNEGDPPKSIDDGIRALMQALEPTRLYQSSSTNGRGVRSGGPYCWREPAAYYCFDEPFKTEIGSMSIPTLESIQGMMPKEDWNTINDDWAEHDFAAGAQQGDKYPGVLRSRYGDIANLADFARKGQMANYEAFRAMFEGREARMFHPSTGVITWMSHPAQPSFVWQLYHYDLEPNASLFAVRKACEPLHIQWNEADGTVQVINHAAQPLRGQARMSVYNLDGSLVYEHEEPVEAAPSAVTTLPATARPDKLSPVYFVRVQLHDDRGNPRSDNFYWRSASARKNDLQALASLPTVTLRARAVRHDASGNCLVDLTLENPGAQVALMAHVQLRRARSGQRVLPVYYSNNYVSLPPHASTTITVEAAQTSLAGEKPLLVVDGWNVAVEPGTGAEVDVALNDNAQVSSMPMTGLTVPGEFSRPLASVQISCGGPATAAFVADAGYEGGEIQTAEGVPIDTNVPEAIYRTERWGEFSYTLPMKAPPVGSGYQVRLHFAETRFDRPGQRRFGVAINGRDVLTEFDVLAEAGGKNRALVKKIPGIRPDADGNIVVEFKRGSADNAKIDGIEVFPEIPSP